MVDTNFTGAIMTIVACLPDMMHVIYITSNLYSINNKFFFKCSQVRACCWNFFFGFVSVR